MADDRAKPRSDERKILHLAEGWEAELWRTAYGATRFRLARAGELLELARDDAQETGIDR